MEGADEMDRSSEFLEESFHYWNNIFEDEALDEVLVYSRKPPAYEQERYMVQLDDAVKRQVEKLAKGNPFTIFTTLISVLDIQIQKYMDKNTSVIGIPTYFKNSEKRVQLRPLTHVISNNCTVKEQLLEMKGAIEAFYRYQGYLLKNISALDERNDEELYFPISIIMEELYSKEQLEMLIGKHSDFQILIKRSAQKIEIEIIYNKLVYGADEIQVFCSMFVSLLVQVTRQFDMTLANLELMDEMQKQKVLYEFNDTKADIPIGKTLVDLLEQRVLQHPEKIAVTCGKNQLTYQELNQKADMIAACLLQRDLQIEQIVGILLERSEWLVVCMFGVLKAGGAYLPIDPEHPDERIHYMLEDSQVAYVLTETALMSKVQEQEKAIDIKQLDLSEEIERKSTSKDKLHSRNLSYVIYTSGSTGRPKGVMIEHEQVVNFIIGMNEGIGLNTYASILGLTTASFDIFGLEVWGSLVNGMELVLTSEGSYINGDHLAELLKNRSVDVLQATPSRLALLLESPAFLQELSNIKMVLVGGEAVPDTLLEFLQKYEHLRIVDVYGPTETTIWSTLKDVTYDSCITIGKPIANTQIYIMKDGKPCGIGMIGEICIGGLGVGRGYWNQPELTKEKFVSYEFAEGLVYHTGDLGRWRNDGILDCLGRMDDQVKLRGLRIELGEIAEVIRKYPLIKNAVAVVQNQEGQQVLCAYVAAEEKIVLSEIKEFLYKQLPAYMVPQYFMQIESIPLNQNGKVDKKALPKIIYERAENYFAPRNDLEQLIAEAFQEIFQLEQVGIYDRFNELGGNSLVAIKLHVALEKRGLKLQIEDINKYQTVQKIAAFIGGETVEEHTVNESRMVLQKEEVDMEGAIYLEGVEPFNQFYYRSCFFNAAFSVAGYYKRDVLSYILSTIITYDEVELFNVDLLEYLHTMGEESEETFFGLQFIECVDRFEMLPNDGLQFTDKDENKSFIENLEEAIAQGHPVIVGLDYFYEDIRVDTYQKEHALHFILVYGYHPKKKIFYIIEHYHRDNLSYDRREISYEVLEYAHKMGYELKNYQTVSPILFYKFTDIGQDTTAQVILNPKKFYLDMMYQQKERLENGLKKLSKFIAYYEQLIQKQSEIEKQMQIFLSHINSIINAKTVEQYKLQRLFSDREELMQLNESIMDKWESIRIRIAKCFYAGSYSAKRLKGNIPLLEEILHLEQHFLDRIMQIKKEEE